MPISEVSPVSAADRTDELRKAIRALEARGLVDSMHGVVKNTVRASLTDAGMREMFPSGIDGSGYVSPLEVERNRLRLERDNLRRQLELVGVV